MNVVLAGTFSRPMRFGTLCCLRLASGLLGVMLMMANEVAMVIEERVIRARTEYRTKLCSRVEELCGLLRSARNDPDALAAAQHLAHRIYGSAGTFGFTAVGDAARAIDQRLLKVLEGAEPMTTALWDELERLLESSRAELCT